MPRICAVVGCDTNRRFYELGLRFYAFPTQNLAARERWRELCGRDASWPIPKLSSVCQKHFPADVVERCWKLDESVLPTLNLPAVEEELEVSVQNDEEAVEQYIEEVEAPRRKNPPRKKRKPKKVMSDQEEKNQEALLTCCRLCVLEMSIDEGHCVKDLRGQDTVGESIWDICMVDLKSTDFEKKYSRICGNCWQRLVEFSDFATLCSSKQSKLFKGFQSQESSKVDQEHGIEEPHVEEVYLGEILEGEELIEHVAEFVEVQDEPQSKDKDLVQDNLMDDPQGSSDEDSTEDEQNRPVTDDSELPSLEGLSIEQMIEALEKIPPKKQIPKGYAIDQECWDCGQVFPRVWMKKKHRKTCALIGKPESLRNKTYVCEICQKNIRTRAGYRLHLVVKHEQTSSGKPEDCPDELRKLQSRKRYGCPVCSKKYQQLHQIKFHLRTHLNREQMGQSDYRKSHSGSLVCQVCGKIFAKITLLKTHLMFHTKQKDFFCDQCEKRFYTKTDLTDHVDSIHLQRKYPCTECGKTYTVRRSLFRHNMAVHRGDKAKYGCSYCEKSFMFPTELRYHEMVHTGERNFKCELCGSAFRQRFELNQHRFRVHAEQGGGAGKLYKRRQRKKVEALPPQDTGEQYDEME